MYMIFYYRSKHMRISYLYVLLMNYLNVDKHSNLKIDMLIRYLDDACALLYLFIKIIIALQIKSDHIFVLFKN
jgi:hypothetical protein